MVASKPPGRRSRGIVLINVLILLLVLLMVTKAMMELSFGRQFQAAQHKRSWAARMINEEVYVALQSCLRDETWTSASGATCAIAPGGNLQMTGFNQTCGAGCKKLDGSATPISGGKTYNFSVEWESGSDGVMRINCVNCM